MCTISLLGQDIFTYLQVTWKKITFFMLNSITCLNSFQVKAVLKHKVIKPIPSLFYCSTDGDFLQRQFMEKAVHLLMLWMLVLQCRKPVYLFISDSLDSISCSTFRQWQPADRDTGARARPGRKSCPHNLWPRQKSGWIQPLRWQMRF